MALTPLTKKTYVARITPVSSSNMNATQDAVIELQNKSLITEAQTLTSAQKTQIKSNLDIAEAVSGNRYVKLPDGTLIQWGTGSFDIPPSTVVSASVTFPISFVGINPVVVANSITTRPQQLVINPSAVSLNGCTLNGWNVVSTVTTYTTYFAWIAIGRWK